MWIFSLGGGVEGNCKGILGSILNPGDLVETASWKGLCSWGRSRCFPISLDSQMLECELFRTSEMTLAILKGFQISFECPNPACSSEKKMCLFLQGQFNWNIHAPALEQPLRGIASLIPAEALLLWRLIFCSRNGTNNTYVSSCFICFKLSVPNRT